MSVIIIIIITVINIERQTRKQDGESACVWSENLSNLHLVYWFMMFAFSLRYSQPKSFITHTRSCLQTSICVPPACRCLARRPPPPLLAGSDRLAADANALGGQRRAAPHDATEDEPGEPHPRQRDWVCPAAAKAGGARRQQTHLSRYCSHSSLLLLSSILSFTPPSLPFAQLMFAKCNSKCKQTRQNKTSSKNDAVGSCRPAGFWEFGASGCIETKCRQPLFTSLTLGTDSKPVPDDLRRLDSSVERKLSGRSKTHFSGGPFCVFDHQQYFIIFLWESWAKKNPFKVTVI